MGGKRGCKVRLPLLGQQSTSSVHDTTARQSTKLHWYPRLGPSSPSFLSDRDSRSGRIVVSPPDPYRPTYDVLLRDETPIAGTLCVPCQVEFRSRLVESGSAGAPREYGARHQGGLLWVTFLGRAKK